MIGAFRQADDVAGARLGIDELGLGIVAIGHVDGDRQLGRVDRRAAARARAAERPGDAQGAGVEGQPFAAHFRAEGQALGGAGEAERDMNDIVARRRGQRRLGVVQFDDQRPRAVRLGAGGEQPPMQPAGQRRRRAGEARRKAQRAEAAVQRSPAVWAAAGAPAATASPSARRNAKRNMVDCLAAILDAGQSSAPVNLRRALARAATMGRIEGGLRAAKMPPWMAAARARRRLRSQGSHERDDSPSRAPPVARSGQSDRAGPERSRARNAADHRLAGSRSRQARAVALHRVRRRGARTGGADRSPDQARRRSRVSPKRRDRPNSRAFRWRRWSSPSFRAPPRTSRFPSGSRSCRPARSA